MKIKYAVITAATVLAGAWTASAGLSFTSGFDAAASNEGGVRYRNFKAYNGAGTTYEGANLDSAAGRIEQVGPNGSSWLASQAFTFTYDATAGTLSSTVGSKPTLKYTYATAPSDINYLKMLMGSDGPSVVTLTGLQINGVDLNTGANGNSYGVGTLNGIGNFYVADNSLMTGFTLTGTINWNQAAGGSQEGPKIQFNLGHSALAPVPEPTTMIAGALLLLPFGASMMRKLRKNHTA